MPYTTYSTAAPNISQTRQAAIDSIRYNLMALRDALVMGELMNWDMTAGDSSSGTSPVFTTPPANGSEPALVRFRNSPEEIMLWITWSTGVPTKIRYYYSPTYLSGYPANLAIIRAENISYDVNGNVTSTSWSAS